ncbi:hypothetical protein [Acinetobacter beijerinckii]|uniref:hypothetical protein n=1 Tax=Acinetobacter beijerinckii TaxID=262668 RepID=UPI00240568AB|nr:hypothetical protein [Acinetobacter beijerinckii]
MAEAPEPITVLLFPSATAPSPNAVAPVPVALAPVEVAFGFASRYGLLPPCVANHSFSVPL